MPVNQAELWSRRVHEPFLAAALLIALTTGFGYAAFLALALALGIPLARWWGPTVQAHGFAQLFGWVGLFVVGIGLTFLPKLRATRLQRADLAPWTLLLLAGGILLRTLAQPLLALSDLDSPPGIALRFVWSLAAALPIGALSFLLLMWVATARAAPPLSRGAPAWPIMPFLQTAALSFSGALIASWIGAILATFAKQAVVAPGWDLLTIQLMVYGVVIPLAFAFAVRNLPLYLRLAAPPRDEFRLLGYGYAFGLTLRLISPLTAILGLDHPLVAIATAVGVLIQAGAILVFIILLDLLRRRPAWTTERAPNTRPDLDYLRKPTRANYPDTGEFGRFELLIYSAFFWLAVGAVMDIARSLGILLAGSTSIPQDASRHALLAGFATLLIFGMAARMVPGLSGKRQVAVPALVMATFLLGNLSALLRVVPVLFPSSTLALALFGSSGLIGWLAVLALAINLYRTFRS